jgi:hypothetical protein
MRTASKTAQDWRALAHNWHAAQPRRNDVCGGTHCEALEIRAALGAKPG